MYEYKLHNGGYIHGDVLSSTGNPAGLLTQVKVERDYLVLNDKPHVVFSYLNREEVGILGLKQFEANYPYVRLEKSPKKGDVLMGLDGDHEVLILCYEEGRYLRLNKGPSFSASTSRGDLDFYKRKLKDLKILPGVPFSQVLS